MARIDGEVEKIRQRIVATVRSAFATEGIADRLLFVDYAEIFERFDSKHDMSEAVSMNGHAWTSHAFSHLRNDERRIRGGLSGLDNFHPSLVGYQLLSREIAVRMGISRTTAEARIPLDDRGDTLLADPPRAAMLLLHAIARIRLGAGPGGAFPLDGSAMASSVETMGILQPADIWRRLFFMAPVRNS
jgi:hypothetical protein